MSNFLDKIPVSPITSFGNPSVPNGATFGTNFSILQTGGYTEVFSLSGLTYTIPSGNTGIIEFSGNSIPIQFTKGAGTVFSPDVLTLNSDNISSGRRKLGMLAYVYETNKIYQFRIDNYQTLWNNATGATGTGGPTVVISEFGSTVKNNSAAGIAFINAWTASTISGVGGYDDTNASWRVLSTGGVSGGVSITGGTFNNTNDTLTLNNSTGGTVTITGFTDYYTTGFTFNPANYDLTIQRNDGLPNLSVNLSILASDVTITGGTYNPSTGTATFTNNTGGTFNVTGFLTGFTDIYVTGGTFNNNTKTLTLRRTDNANVNITGFTDVFVTGATKSGSVATFRNNTGGTFTLTGLTDTFVTGATKSGSVATFTNNTGGTFTLTGLTDVFVTGATKSGSVATFRNNTGGTFTLTGLTDTFVTSGTYNSGTLTFTNNTGGTFNVTGLTNDKIILKRIELGTRYVYQDPDVALVGSLDAVFTNRLTDGIFNGTLDNNYHNVKVDFFITYYNGNINIREKLLYRTQSIGIDLNSYNVFDDINEYIVSNNYIGNVNFYCEMYLELNSNYSPPTQVRLTNTLFNSLNPYKYSRGRNYQGISEFVRSNYNLPIKLNSIESNFIQNWEYYYTSTTSNDIVRNIYNIIYQPDFYGQLSGQSQSVILPVVYSDGSIDPLFQQGQAPGPNGRVLTIAIQNDNKILLGGLFVDYNNISSSGIVRVNTNGYFDGTFSAGTGFSSAAGKLEVRKIIIQSDGKILVGGFFDDYNGTFANRIIRLNIDGSVDNTFLYGTGFDGAVNDIFVLSDEKILIVGEFSDYNGDGSNYIIKVDSNGVIDNSFVIGTGFDGDVRSVVVQSDNKVLVGGDFSSYDGVGSDYIIRLNSDGSVDGTFNIGGSFDDNVYDIVLQTDGKILVGGIFTSYDGNTANSIIRLNSDGSVDGTFNPGSGFNSIVRSIELQSDGKIIVCGDFTSIDGNTRNRIIRLNTDGSIDNSFNIGTGFDDFTLDIAIQTDNRIIVGGEIKDYNGTALNYVVRLGWDFKNSQAVLQNSTFVEPLTSFYSKYRIPTNNYSFFESCDLLTNNFYGEILYDFIGTSPSTVGSSGSATGFGVFSSSFYQMIDTYRLYPNGTPGLIFYNSVLANTELNNLTFSMGIDRLTKYIGRDNSYVQVLPYYQDVYILKLNVIGTPGDDGSEEYIDYLTNNFLKINDNSLTSTNGYWYHGISKNEDGLYYLHNLERFINNPYGPYLVIQSSDEKMLELSQNPTYNISTQFQSEKFYMGGTFTYYNGTGAKEIIKLKDDGVIETQFNYGGGFYGPVHKIFIQPDGKVLVGGNYTDYNGTPTNNIVRLNYDGGIDNAFNIGTGTTNTVAAIDMYTDGRILIGGNFTSYDGTSANRIIRLNNDGSVDNSFNPGSGFTDQVYVIKIQTDGKILVGGAFGSYDGNSSSGIVRLNSDGSIDNSFVVGTGFDSNVNDIIILSDGKILAGGKFTDYDGNSVNSITRLNSDGTFDNSFVIGTGFNNEVYSMLLQSDNKIIVGGDFTDYDGTGVNRIIRLNSNGTQDTSFNIGSGFNAVVYSLSSKSDGKILVGGDFTNYDGGGYTRIIMLNTDGTVDGSFVMGIGFDEKVLTIATEYSSINVESIYKGKSFKPSVYPLNMNQLTFEVPKSSDSFNKFIIDGSKKLRFIIKYTKLQKYDIVLSDFNVTNIRTTTDNKFFTLELSNNLTLEKVLLEGISNSNRKQFRPGSVEIFLSFYDNNTKETSLVPNYKIIVVKYGDSEIFKLIRGGSVNNNLTP